MDNNPADSTGIRRWVGKFNDGLLDEKNISRNRDEVVVQIKYKRSIEYDILSRNRDDRVTLSIRRI